MKPLLWGPRSDRWIGDADIIAWLDRCDLEEEIEAAVDNATYDDDLNRCIAAWEHEGYDPTFSVRKRR